MTRVLVALDESAASVRAARAAVRLFPSGDTEFLVVNVARVSAPWVPAPPYGGVAVVESGWTGAMSGMGEDELDAIARRAGVPEPHVLTEAGNPASRICEAADEHDVDVIVVGGHDKGLLARLFDPSVSSAVVRATHRPVLVVSGDPPS
ncbi:MAG TPA: universal stress protein [Acidimicrobiales bacterium]